MFLGLVGGRAFNGEMIAFFRECLTRRSIQCRSKSLRLSYTVRELHMRQRMVTGLALLLLIQVQSNADITLTSDVSNSTDKGNNTTYVATVTLTTDATHHKETLDFLVKNTSSSSVGGYLTGIVLKEVSGATYVSGSYLTNNSHFSLVTNASASPFGTFPVGAALGGNWLGGGSPNNGIAANGGTGDFKFTFSYTGTAPTETDWKNILNGNGFVARFKGLTNGGSNKVPDIASTGVSTDSVTPEPSTFVIAALGTLGFLAYGLRCRVKT